MIDPEWWGVSRSYTDASGRPQVSSDGTVSAVLRAMGAGPGRSRPGPDSGGALVVREGDSSTRLGTGRVALEDGGDVGVDHGLPPDIPPGYHRFRPQDGEDRRLIVTPGRCPLPPAPSWGWAAQLYATRSSASWGIGDLGDLAELARWSGEQGAGLVLVNPLHATAPGPDPQPSPYYPASRCFRSPLYLRVDAVVGAGAAELGALGDAARALNEDRVIDRRRVWEAKGTALERIYAAVAGRPGDGFDEYVAAEGATLSRFATWCALAEIHGTPWREWPEELRHPDGPAVAAFAASAEGRRRIRYHLWLQWNLDRQLAAVPGPVGVVQDLAIGVDPGGADAWMWQDAFAPGMSVGAPPDEFNTRGQDWGLPPFDPWKLRAADYEPFVQTVRAGLRHAGGLRVDHVMGLFRLWWIPEDAAAADGVYVSYPAADLLGILALEAQRAGAYVVGEDLGTVEPGVREELAERGVLSYRVLWFEDRRPDSWTPHALAAVTTHDLPTIAGVWTGSDLQAQRDLGLSPNEAGSEEMRRRLEDWTGASADTPIEDLVADTYRLLAAAPCTLLAATLDDLCQVEERPNMPGTTDERPNWSLALPLLLEDIEKLDLARRVADLLNRSS